MTAFVMAALLAAGLVWGVWALAHARLDRDQVNLNAWLNGTAGAALNKSLRLPEQDTVETWNAAVRYRLLGDVGDQVAMGCPQWMFYRDGMRPKPGTKDVVFEDRLRLMNYWLSQVRAQGVNVLVVAVPDKARIESAHLCGRQVSQAMLARLDVVKSMLQREGVPFVDLRPTLADANQPMFFRTDVHMNADGARAAAARVALAGLSLLQGKGAQAFDVGTPAPAQPRVGDLLALSGLEHARGAWRPRPDLAYAQHIAPIRAGGLLDDTPPVEVMLAGSSHGRRSNFAEWLGVDLGREVWNLSLDGGDFAGALTVALKQRAQWPKSLKLVIWEFSENALSLPLSDDEKSVLTRLP
ncbi:MAG: cell division protein FtsQ [Pandoraea sp.]|nr:cell division protein FtsQ [Pandoraea sp.]MDR3397397.1 cell division protein FtsQ [Pandoraea sp.]